MTLLELNSDELRQKIEAELASNPALELADVRRCPTCQRVLSSAAPCPICARPGNLPSNLPIVFVSPYTDFHPKAPSTDSDDVLDEDWNVAVDELPVYVLRQIATELDPDDRAIAANILTSLDDDGLLRTPLAEFARYHHVPIARIEKVLALIQHADPIGVGCSSPQEALLIQLAVLAETTRIPVLTRKVILEHMDLLSRRAYNELGKVLGISPKEAQKIAIFISDNLNPFPARAHWGDIHYGAQRDNVSLSPDILITYLEGSSDSPFVVEIITPYAGSIRVNPLFREVINQAPSEKLELWQEHLESANLLVKCLQQRNNTMVRMMEQLVILQRNYLLQGDAYLLPATRAQIAEKLEVHESTVSRAVSGKAVQLPNNRIIPLSKFFDRSLHIRTALRDIISQENKPLSDTEIAEKLVDMGFPVARRTVAKYRAMEGILPARFRQSSTAVLAP
jgi:RNA polymerase sigma-54 factor